MTRMWNFLIQKKIMKDFFFLPFSKFIPFKCPELCNGYDGLIHHKGNEEVNKLADDLLFVKYSNHGNLFH